MPSTFAGAVDCVGGSTLAGVIARLQPGAAVAASGNTGGAQLETTVLPFILRGVSLLGIDSVTTPIDRRQDVWRRLATDMRPQHLDAIARPVRLAEVEGALDEIAAGGVIGRYVVDVMILATLPTDDVVTRLQAEGVPCAKVTALEDLPDLVDDVSPGFLVKEVHPHLGEMVHPRAAALFEEDVTLRPAPWVGEHTDEILAELDRA
jgi:hypothetical protein